ncbi:MAG: ATP-dependent RecD-like DNA helicase [Pseudomonadota bacterium]
MHCSVERVTFRNDETLYSVIRLRDHKSMDVFTAVGELASCSEGEDMIVEGHWQDHPKYGPQLRILKATPVMPSTLDGIEKYLGSGGIPGIGGKFAERIVRKFGQDTFKVIEENPEKLRKIRGLGKNRIEKIGQFVKQREKERETMLFLYSHGITPAYAIRIIRQYKDGTISEVTKNPYRLAGDITGIGFRMADRLALNLGLMSDSPERIRAGAMHVLGEAESEGHCFLTKQQLLEAAAAALSIDLPKVEKELALMIERRQLVSVEVGDMPGCSEPFECVYTRGLFMMETQSAGMLETLLTARKKTDKAFEPERQISRAQRSFGMTFAQKQRDAIAAALTEKASIITGGPGTGKTTIVRAITAICRRLDRKVFLCAPTGRAAKRLSDTTGRKAKTIHRLLRWSPAGRTFDHNRDNPLKCDMLIVDEMSMVDIRLFYCVLRALKAGTGLLLVGDADQLPSVGPGCVLRDLINSEKVPVTRLDEIFRQAASSMIISNAHRINSGSMPAFHPDSGQTQDFFFIDRAEPEAIADAVVEMATSRIPAKYTFNPLTGIQVLSPMHKGVMGAQSLNERLSSVLNRAGQRVPGASGPITPGDKVMQIRNNYDLEVFNGDIGVVVGANAEEKTLTVDYDGRHVTYGSERTDELVKAYAISIHKSQGSEYDAVVVPISTSHFIMLQRNLIYTAVTRARKLAVLVGTKKALAIAIKNDKVRERNTLLASFLSGKIKPPDAGA